MIDNDARNAATRLLDICRARGMKIATAESCTGGLVAAAMTEIPDSSDVLDRGFVTYSNAAKQSMLGVPAGTLKEHGAVSRQTAEAMARGALGRADVSLVVAITGVAGPGGGTKEKPVGLVHVAVSGPGTALRSKRLDIHGPREAVRSRAVTGALALLKETLDGHA